MFTSLTSNDVIHSKQTPLRDISVTVATFIHIRDTEKRSKPKYFMHSKISEAHDATQRHQ